MISYETPLCESVSLYSDDGILQESGFGDPGTPGSDLVTDEPFPFGVSSLLNF